jgi:predicted PurR-regulated permease PerM
MLEKGYSQIIALLAAVIVVWLAIELKEIILLVVVSYVISYLIHPFVTKLEKYGLSRTVGVFVIGVVSVFIIGGVVGALLPFVIREFSVLIDQLPNYLAQAKGILAQALVNLKIRSVQLPEVSELLTTDNVQRVASVTWNTLFAGYSAGMALVNLTLLPFCVFYITISFDEIHQGMLELFPLRYRLLLTRIGREINTDVSAYVRGQFAVATALFCLYAVFLKVLGIELWFVLALVSGYGSMVPYLGLGLGIVLTSLVALVTLGDLGSLFFVWAGYAVVQMIESFLLTPTLVGRSVGLSPLVIILALICGASLGGILGMVLAIPCAAALRVVAKYVRSYYIGVT